MSKQNIFDDDRFYTQYYALRQNPDCANNLEEKPALFSMLDDLSGKRVLDMGCGYGENCLTFSRMGADSVVGIDISEKMLAVANQENRAENIVYHRLPMEDAGTLNRRFDVVVSSLAMHYVRDFDALTRLVYALLDAGGLFLFSQEHPLTTAPMVGPEWCKDPGGVYYKLTDYGMSGERSVAWFIDGIEKYHRTFSDLVNGLAGAGFVIERMAEPLAAPEVRKRLPGFSKNVHKPNFLMIRARKTGP